MKLRAALLVDNLSLTKWQQAALNAALEKMEVVMVLNCENTKIKKKYIKNFLYYVLNIVALRNDLTKKRKIKNTTQNIINFDSSYQGSWQSIPADVYDAIDEQKIDLVIKFGMNLLRIEEKKNSPPFLSYHHGDPSKYRGRPAGFYEILNGELTSGIIVQKLSNQLDAGRILAFVNSKVINYSYKKTAKNFYGNSEHLLKKAIDNLINGNSIELIPEGKNYFLPSNSIVIKFVALMIWNAVKKISYGLFFEKKWRVAISDNKLALKGDEKLSSLGFTELPINSKYNFYADPFFSEDGNSIRLEALDNSTGLGDILEIAKNDLTEQKVLLSGEHYSYPFSFLYEGKEYLLPEVASHSSQYIYLLDNIDGVKYTVKGLENKRIADATLVHREGCYFLFFGENTTALTTLNLWYSDSPFGKFNPHPMNPIVISPSTARMGGKLVFDTNRLIRLGQNNSGEYGESLSVLEVTKLSPTSYEEKLVGSITIDGFKGPHSLGFNADASKILIDYYNNKFSLFAGVRRLKAKFNNK